MTPEQLTQIRVQEALRIVGDPANMCLAKDFGAEVALAMARLIETNWGAPPSPTDIRSNPQPGSEGEAVAWRYRVWRGETDGWTNWAPCSSDEAAYIKRSGRVSDVPMKAEAQALYAASPTPPTAQPGEVERLRSALEPFAMIADKLDGLGEEAVVLMTYDDPEWGPDTVCGELFVRPFRRARQALKDNSND